MAQNTIAVFGVESGTEYEIRVTGDIGPAPVHDAAEPDTGAHVDKSVRDKIRPPVVEGRDTGEGDGYWYTGDIKSFKVKRGSVARIVCNGVAYGSAKRFRNAYGVSGGGFMDSFRTEAEGDTEHRVRISSIPEGQALYRMIVKGSATNTEAPAGRDYVTTVGEWSIISGSVRRGGDEFVVNGPVAKFDIRGGSPTVYLDGSTSSTGQVVSQTGGDEVDVPSEVTDSDGWSFPDMPGIDLSSLSLSSLQDRAGNLSTYHWAGLGLLGGAFAYTLRDGEVLGQPEEGEVQDENAESEE